MSKTLTAAQKKNLERLVEALLSGEYQQGEGLLKDREGGYCCLGVACEILKPNAFTLKMHERLGVAYYNHPLKDSIEDEYLKPDVGLSKFGFTERDQKSLAEMNDGGAPFAHIAEVITLSTESGESIEDTINSDSFDDEWEDLTQ